MLNNSINSGPPDSPENLQDESQVNSDTTILDENDKIIFQTTELDKNSPANDPQLLNKNELINSPHRFNLMLLLYNFHKMRCITLAKRLGITYGNLDHHSRHLIKIGWIREWVVFDFRPLKVLEITTLGLDEFQQYIIELKKVLRHLSEVGEREFT